MLTGRYPAWCYDESGHLLRDEAMVAKIGSLTQDDVDSFIGSLDDKRTKDFLGSILKVDPAKRPLVNNSPLKGKALLSA